MQPAIAPIALEMETLLTQKMLPFWLERSIDGEYGGYLTCVDENGVVNAQADKMIVTQTRMLWGFSSLRAFVPDAACAGEMAAAAHQGYDFLMKHFWDREHGGFCWMTARDGRLLDAGKLMYAQSFGIYALSAYFLAYGNPEALVFAEKTFDLIQVYAADTANGGYLENLEADWSPAGPGWCAGDRKSLDIHMHLMEAFTLLYQATGKELHRRKLREVTDLILRYMIDPAGYGRNQFGLKFNVLPAINIRRTWNAERESNEAIAAPTDTTSYGHNVELSWLLQLACDTMGAPGDAPILQKLLDHSLLYGYDYEYGGVYRDGVGESTALVTDKEWWQNFESLVGYLNGYLRYGDGKYLAAFAGTWEFIKKYFLVEGLGESRQLLRRDGTPVVSGIGNPWKGIYHTGRALSECVRRIRGSSCEA
ncbi:MAG: AGE family epimerase/isomerase [Oscillospiraceae bacterium]|nr:AGE family epimerase/isomerase [Oscillospiraceae bacterium]